jgi:hypothetical protein
MTLRFHASGHVDAFSREHLPPAEQWPVLRRRGVRPAPPNRVELLIAQRKGTATCW